MKKVLLTIAMLLFTISPTLAQECDDPIDNFIQEFENIFSNSDRHIMTNEELNNFMHDGNEGRGIANMGIWWTDSSQPLSIYVLTGMDDCILTNIGYNKEEFYNMIKRN